jgi:hypothetical protein
VADPNLSAAPGAIAPCPPVLSSAKPGEKCGPSDQFIISNLNHSWETKY